MQDSELAIELGLLPQMLAIWEVASDLSDAGAPLLDIERDTNPRMPCVLELEGPGVCESGWASGGTNGVFEKRGDCVLLSSC